MSAVTAVPLRPLARGSVPKLWIGLLILTLAAIGLGWWGTRSLQRTTLPSGVVYQVIREGEGNAVTGADIALVHFVARRASGETFADSRRSQPLEANPDNFPVPGLGEGLKLMRKGALYRFWVPQSVYRDQLPPQIRVTPGEVLTFDLQVVDLAPGAAQMQRMQALQQQLRSGAPEAAVPGPGAPGAPPPVVPAVPGNVAVPR